MSSAPISIHQAENYGEKATPNSGLSKNQDVSWRDPNIEMSPNACRYCGKCFTRRKSTANHEKFVHEQVPRYRCRHCSEPFLRRWHKKQHERTHAEINNQEEEEPKWLRTKCQKGYVTERGQLIHERIRHFSQVPPNRRFTCSICGKVWKSKYNLKNHERVFHKECFPELVIVHEEGVGVKPATEGIDNQLATELQVS